MIIELSKSLIVSHVPQIILVAAVFRRPDLGLCLAMGRVTIYLHVMESTGS
jgi:hypothetical protein